MGKHKPQAGPGWRQFPHDSLGLKRNQEAGKEDLYKEHTFFKQRRDIREENGRTEKGGKREYLGWLRDLSLFGAGFGVFRQDNRTQGGKRTDEANVRKGRRSVRRFWALRMQRRRVEMMEAFAMEDEDEDVDDVDDEEVEEDEEEEEPDSGEGESILYVDEEAETVVEEEMNGVQMSAEGYEDGMAEDHGDRTMDRVRWKVVEGKDGLRDLTGMAIWSVSSAKPGNGVDCLLDRRADSYWQSDGTQPHSISGQFSRKVRLVEVRLLLDFSSDESYTPQRISLRVGSNFHDLREIRSGELHKPQGWVVIPFAAPEEVKDEENQPFEIQTDHSVKSCIRAHMMQIVVHSNHQNGRDTHIRRIKVMGHRTPTSSSFKSSAFQEYEFLR